MHEHDTVSWALIEDATRRVLDVPSTDRQRALDEVCGDDVALRREVEGMLDAIDASDTFMSAPAMDGIAAAGPAPEAPAALPGTSGRDFPEIGGYRVLEVIGAGGMGTVYRAERTDGHFEQQVAIKVLRTDAVDASFRARFKQETQILARLRHRHIAALLDAGVTASDTPYFVMEYVAGSPITAYCDRSRLPIADRLQLFMQVCRGVGHAHRNHVVHRDLKPSNLLVSTEAETKLLDFGIAKVLERDGAGTSADVPLTRTAEVVLTPLYAAPEQIRGSAIGPAADVFVLGLVLYELLTGRHPFVTDAWSVGETERAILDLDPEPPSRAVMRMHDVAGAGGRRTRVHPDIVGAARGTTPDRLRASLRGDLDAIVLRSLAKDSADRYPDADALGRDLERHVLGRPVAARVLGPLPRAVGALRRRFRSWIGAAPSPSGSAREAGRQARRADAMMSFLARMFELAAPSSSGDPKMTAREMLDWAAEHVDDELAGEPDARADILVTLGRILHEIGDDVGAIPVLERSVEAQRRLYGGRDPRVLPALKWLATAYQDQAEHEKAETVFRAALGTTRAAYGERHLEVSIRLNDLALVLDRQGKLTEAKKLYEQSLAIKREQLPDDDPQVMTIVNNLAVVLQRMGHSRAAEHLLHQVLAARRRLYGNESVYVATALSNLMIAHRRRGDHAGAEPLGREALALRERVLGKDHPDTALSRFNLACAVRDLGREDEAEPMLTAARETYARARGEAHPVVSGMVLAMATSRRRQSRLEEAETLARSALESLEASLGPSHPKVANARYEIGLTLLEAGRAPEAEPWLARTLETRTECIGAESPVAAEARAALGRCWIEMGRAEEARAALEGATAVLRRTWGDQHPETRAAARALASIDLEKPSDPSPGRISFS